MTTMFKYKELKQEYGEQILQKVRKYEHLSVSKAKSNSHLLFNMHCKHHNVIPKSLKIKSPIDNAQARILINKTQKVMLNIRISETIEKQKYLNYEFVKVENELKNALPTDLFNLVKINNMERGKRVFENSATIQKKKFQNLINKPNKRNNLNQQYHNQNQQNQHQNQQNTNTNSQLTDIKSKWVKNLSKRNMTQIETEVLSKGAGFAITPNHIPYNDYIIETKKACKKT